MEKQHSGRYEFVGETSKKFWEATLEGNTVTVHYGRIGTAGKTFKKVFFHDAVAYNYFSDKISEKCAKGYKHVGTASYLQSDSASAVICSTCVGEHIIVEAKSLCRWLTECLQNKMSIKEFKKTWKKFIENGEKEDWTNDLEFEYDLVSDGIYRKAVEGGADKFITFDNNSYIDIVAIRGKPTPREIALLVLGCEENVGDWDKKDTAEALGKY